MRIQNSHRYLAGDRLREIALSMLILSALGTSVAGAKVIIVRSGTANATAKNGFSVVKEDQATADALAEFDRYCEKSAWEKAFTTLEKVAAKPAKGLVAVDDNFFVPTRERLRQELVAMSPEGKQAFRLFYDAKARQQFALLDPANAPDSDSDAATKIDDLTKLQDLYDRYFISSIGDQIADRLGDALFEAGEYSAAAAAWQSVIADYPDTSLSPSRLRTKRAIALARSGNTIELSAVVADIRDKFPGEHLKFGGRDVDVANLLTVLTAPEPKSVFVTTTSPATAPATLSSNDLASASDSFTLPATDDPLWQCNFADAVFNKQIEQMMNSGNFYYMTTNFATIVPASATDGRRIYMNWFGVGMAVDIESGKLVWRTSTFKDIATKLQQGMMRGYGGGMADDAVVPLPSGQRVLFVRQDLDAASRGEMPAGAKITCLDSNNGKVIWTSASGALAGWQFGGEPIVDSDVIYAAARAQNTAELSLLAISPDNGNLLWSAKLGTMTLTQDYRGQQTSATPALKIAGKTLYLLTSNGALLAVDLHSRRVNWAFTYPTPAAASGEVFYYNQGPRNDPPHFASSLGIFGTTLFLKDKDNAGAYAIDLADRSMKWTRRTDTTGTIVGTDAAASQMYVLSDGFGAIDLTTRDLKWSTKLPITSADSKPIIFGTHAYVFASRGVFDIDLKTGSASVFRGADRDSAGGAIYRVGEQLICVSNRSVTAYPLSSNSTSKGKD